jgi:phospholipid N-methyltransferase
MKDKDYIFLVDKYNKNFEKFGVSPSAVGWVSGKQKERYSKLFEGVGDFNSVIDIGCGLGDLYKFIINQKGVEKLKYIGTEINQNFIKTCQEKYPEANFILQDNIIPSFKNKSDVVVMSGLFNTPLDSNDLFLKSLLDASFSLSKKYITFNFLSNDVDYKDNNLNYTSLGYVIEYCEKKSKKISIIKSIIIN